MKKTDPRKYKLNWSRCGLRPRATWDLITSSELAAVLGVSLQTISNWKLRKLIPPPSYTKAHRNFYRICEIMAHHENLTEDEIHRRFIKQYIPYARSLDEAKFYVMHGYTVLGLEKPRLPDK